MRHRLWLEQELLSYALRCSALENRQFQLLPFSGIKSLRIHPFLLEESHSLDYGCKSPHHPNLHEPLVYSPDGPVLRGHTPSLPVACTVRGTVRGTCHHGVYAVMRLSHAITLAHPTDHVLPP